MAQLESLAKVIDLAQRTATRSPAEQRIEEAKERSFRRHQAAMQRAENLRRADPPLSAEDVHVLVSGQGIRQTPALRSVLSWARETGPRRQFLGLCGFVGRGKTMAACLYLAHHGGSYVRESELPRAIRFERERMVNSRVLVVDELGRSKSVDSTAPAVFELVDERQREGRRTILLSNLSRAQLQAFYPDPGAWSRLNRACTWATAEGNDLRRGEV